MVLIAEDVFYINSYVMILLSCSVSKIDIDWNLYVQRNVYSKKKLDFGWGKFTFYQIGNYGIAFSYVTLQIHPSCQEYKRIYACISDLHHLSHIHTQAVLHAPWYILLFLLSNIYFKLSLL